MSLYDRPYMRAVPPRVQRGPLPALKILISVNIAVYLLQCVFNWWFGTSWMERVFALSGDGLRQGFLWTFVSYGFLHDAGMPHFRIPANPFHLLLNMLLLFFMGRPLQQELGPHRLLLLYLCCALGGAVTWLLFNHERGILLGASAAVLGFLTLWCLRHRDQEVTFLLWFIIPVRLKPKYVLWAVAGLEVFLFLFSEMTSGSSRVAYSAHLGGMATAAVFHWIFSSGTWKRPRSPWSGVQVEDPPWAKRRSRPFTGATRVNLEGRDKVRTEVDRILDKINSQGFGSLTEEEKRTLDRARDLMRD